MEITFFADDKVLENKVGLNHEELWKAGLCLDDWDYGLIVNGKKAYNMEKNYTLNRLLTGCCSNEWFQIKNKKGRWFTIGMAYHS